VTPNSKSVPLAIVQLASGSHIYLDKHRGVYYFSVKIGAATIQNWPPLDAGKQR